MTILGIETATVVCGAAVVMNGKILAESTIAEPHAHTAMLMTQVEEAIRRSGISLGDVEGFAVSIGPGSFTGLRIGVSVAKGLAWASGKRLTAVPTLRAMALTAVRHGHVAGSGLLLAALNSRRNELYRELFELVPDGLNPVSEMCVMTPEELLAELNDRAVTIVTDSQAFREKALLHPKLQVLSPEASRCSAADVALEGESRLLLGMDADPSALEPMYGKEFQTTLRATS